MLYFLRIELISNLRGDIIKKFRITKKYLNFDLAIIVIGILAGLGANGLGYVLSITEKTFLNFHESPKMSVSMLIEPEHRLISVFLGAILASLIWYFLHKKYHLTSVNEALAGKRMSVRATLLTDLTQSFYIGAGGSVGRETALRELAAMIAQKISKFSVFQFDKEDVQLLIAAAAGAGLDAQYVTPLSGTIFSLLLLHRVYNKKNIIVSFSMSVIATLVGSLREGFRPYYTVKAGNFTWESLPLLIILGLLLGFLGWKYKGIIAYTKRKKITNNKILLMLPCASLLTGIISIFCPYIMGNGRGIAQLAYTTNNLDSDMIILLCICLLMKAFITAFTIYSGAYGGILTPSISIEAVSGILIGFIYNSIFSSNISLINCALFGSVSFLTATQQSLLLGIVLIAELCHVNNNILLEFIIVAINVPKLYTNLKENYKTVFRV